MNSLALQGFEKMFLAWLDRNQEELEETGTENLRELETLCASWAQANLFEQMEAMPLHKIFQLAVFLSRRVMTIPFADHACRN
jgi:uncharacterized protein YecA (UPF0149 family)